MAHRDLQGRQLIQLHLQFARHFIMKFATYESVRGNALPASVDPEARCWNLIAQSFIAIKHFVGHVTECHPARMH